MNIRKPPIGPIRSMDLSFSTPLIILKSGELKNMSSSINISEQDILSILEYLSNREIVHISIENVIE